MIDAMNILALPVEGAPLAEKPADAAAGEEWLKILQQVAAVPEEKPELKAEIITAQASIEPVFPNFPSDDVAVDIISALTAGETHSAATPALGPEILPDFLPKSAVDAQIPGDLEETKIEAGPVSADAATAEDLSYEKKIKDFLADPYRAYPHPQIVAADPAILQLAQDRLSELLAQPENAALDHEALARLRSELDAFLTAQGLDQNDIARHLAAFDKILKHEDPRVPPLDPRVLPAVAPPRGRPLSQTVADAAPILPEHLDLLSGRKDMPAAPADDSSQPQKALRNPRPMPAEILPSPPPTAPLVTQTSVKTPAPVLTPGAISVLAQDSGTFSSDGFSAGKEGNKPGDLMNTTLLAKPEGAEALNRQTFANYLHAAKAPGVTTQMVSVNLARNISARIDTMTLQLMPEDLGRLDIELKFEKDHTVKARLTAEKPETLALLQRDAHHLERVLQQSGLDLDDSSISFDLRDSGKDAFEKFERDGFGDDRPPRPNDTKLDNAAMAHIAVQANGYVTQSGVNIMV